MTRFAGPLLLLSCLLLAGCASLPSRPEPPRVSLVDLKLVSMELFEQRYAVRLRMKNPNAFALPVRGIDFRLDINGQTFADGVSSQAVDVPAYGESVVALQVTSNLMQVFRQLQSLENSQSPVLAWRLNGSVAVGETRLRLPFDHVGELPLVQRRDPGTGAN